MRLAQRGAVHVGVARADGARHIELLVLGVQRHDTVGPAIRNTLAARAGVVNPFVEVREVVHVVECKASDLIRIAPVSRVLEVQTATKVAVVAANANKQAKAGSGLDVQAAQRGIAQIDSVLPHIPNTARAIHQTTKRKCIVTRLGNSQRGPARFQGVSARRTSKRNIRVCPAIAKKTAAGLLDVRIVKRQARKRKSVDVKGLRRTLFDAGDKPSDAKIILLGAVDFHLARNRKVGNGDSRSRVAINQANDAADARTAVGFVGRRETRINLAIASKSNRAAVLDRAVNVAGEHLLAALIQAQGGGDFKSGKRGASGRALLGCIGTDRHLTIALGTNGAGKLEVIHSAAAVFTQKAQAVVVVDLAVALGGVVGANDDVPALAIRLANREGHGVAVAVQNTRISPGEIGCINVLGKTRNTGAG